jgi:TRAP transporter TAXI family solute receptor
MGAGPQGSATFASTQALQKVVNENAENVEISAQETSGTGPSNFRLYDNGEIDAGGFDNFAAAEAVNDSGSFADNPVDNVPYQGFFYVLAHMYVVTRAETDIQTTDDLAGANVWLNPPGTSVRPPTDAVFQEAGLYDQINLFEMGRGDLPGALEEERVDAAVVYGVNYKTLPGWVSELDARFELRAVTATEEFRQAIQDAGGTTFEEVDTYGWDQDIGADTAATWNLGAQFRFGDGVSAEAAKAITRLAYEQNDAIIEANAIYPEYSEISEMTNGLIADQPVHPGVAEFWQDEGAWNDSWTTGEL